MLPFLRGHEDTVLQLVADFLGVTRGRKLQIAREALAVMSAIEVEDAAAARWKKRTAWDTGEVGAIKGGVARYFFTFRLFSTPRGLKRVASP